MSLCKTPELPDSPSEYEGSRDTQDSVRGEDIEESNLLKSFNDRSLGLSEAITFFQEINYLAFYEEVLHDRCCPFSKPHPSYIGSDESNLAKLMVMPSKTCFGNVKQYIMTDISGIEFCELLVKRFSKANKKIVTKSPHGVSLGSIVFKYEGYTSNDEFEIMNSKEEVIMSMKPEHINLHTFEFPVKDANNSYVANIFHKGNLTTLQMSPNLSPKFKLLLVPLVILLMNIKAKLKKKQSL